MRKIEEAQVVPQGLSYMRGPDYVALVFRRRNRIVKLRLRKRVLPVQVWVSSF